MRDVQFNRVRCADVAVIWKHPILLENFILCLTSTSQKRPSKRLARTPTGRRSPSWASPTRKNINEAWESPSIKIIEELVNLGTEVWVYDPFVPSIRTKAGVFASVESIDDELFRADCAIFLVDHDLFREISVETMKGLMASPVIMDRKNLFTRGEGIVYLGIGKGLI